MSIKVSCSCGKILIAKETLAGKKVKCPSCGKVIPIPVQQAAEPKEEPAEPRDRKPKKRKKKKRSSLSKGDLLYYAKLGSVGVLLVAAVIGGILLLGGVSKTIQEAGGSAKSGDWTKDYDAFYGMLKEKGNTPYLVLEAVGQGESQGFSMQQARNGRKGTVSLRSFTTKDGTPTGTVVRWEAVYLGLDKGMFDLPKEHRWTPTRIDDNSGAAVYEVRFQAAKDAKTEWEAVEKGKKIRFTGRVGRINFEDIYWELGVRHRLVIEIHDVRPETK